MSRVAPDPGGHFAIKLPGPGPHKQQQQQQLQLTLTDLDERSYHTVRDSADDPFADYEGLKQFHKCLGNAVVITNLFICLMHTLLKRKRQQQQQPQQQDNVELSLEPSQQEFLQEFLAEARLKWQDRAERLQPPVIEMTEVEGRDLTNFALSKATEALNSDDVKRDLKKLCRAISKDNSEKSYKPLLKLAHVFAAYQPAALAGEEEALEGNDVTCTQIRAVKDRVTQPVLHGDIATLGGTLLKLLKQSPDVSLPPRVDGDTTQSADAAEVAEVKEGSLRAVPYLLKELLKAACRSGHKELVRVEELLGTTDKARSSCKDMLQLLHPRARGRGSLHGPCFSACCLPPPQPEDSKEAHPAAEVLVDILCVAWGGYEIFKPEEKRCQKRDWLDYRGSCARAVIIAYMFAEFWVWLQQQQAQEKQPPEYSLIPVWDQLLRDLKRRPIACKPMAQGLVLLARELHGEKGTQGIYVQELAAQALHLAIFSDNLAVVAEARVCIQETKAWPALNFKMLAKLAECFPTECVQLLAGVKLEPVKLRDNVLSFKERYSFKAIAASSYQDNDESGCTKDEEYFSWHTQQDPPIEASLLARGRTWLAMLLLLGPVEWPSPTFQQMRCIMECVFVAFICQGPGHLVAALLAGTAILALKLVLWMAAVMVCIFGFIYICGYCILLLPLRKRCAPDVKYKRLERDWQQMNKLRIFLLPHYKLVNFVVGWGRGATTVLCGKVPIVMDFKDSHDLVLMEKLLQAPGVPPAVFGSTVLRSVIMFRWHYFIKYFTYLRMLLHTCYLVAFILYAFSITLDMEPRHDGEPASPHEGEHDDPHCHLDLKAFQSVLLYAIGAITVDFTFQEIRQIFHFKTKYLSQSWEVLDFLSVILMIAIIVTHFTCKLGPLFVSSIWLRRMVAVQVVLLFARTLYYAMAFKKLGNFVRMVLMTASKLKMFFVFLAISFAGFALAIMVSQGSRGAHLPVGTVLRKLTTMIFGDFDSDFLSRPWEEELEIQQPDWLTSILVAGFMIVVTIILLNLLIAIINESYTRIRENERWESLRNKALLIVGTESLLRGPGFWSIFCCFGFADWLYKKLLKKLAPPRQPPL